MSTSIAVTERCRSNPIVKLKRKKGSTQQKTSGRKERKQPDKFEYKDFFFELDCVLKQLGYLKSRENSIKETEHENKINKNKNRDFFYRLKNLYNKQMTTVKPRKCCTNRRIVKTQTPVLNGNQVNGKIKIEAMLNKNVSLKRTSMKQLICYNLENEKIKNSRILKEKPTAVECGRCHVPKLEDLPEDEAGFDELVRRYIGGEIDNLSSNGECGCPEEVLINGSSTLADLTRGLSVLASSHKVTSVVLTLRKPNQNVDEEIDSKKKAKFCKKTPPILTKFGLHSVCEQVGAHPSLRSLRIERVPLSQPCQAMLVPSFATLRELRLIGNRLGDDGVARVCRFAWRSAHLRLLDLSQNGFGRTGASHIARMLERRAVARTAGLHLCRLERIVLDKNPIGYEGFCELLNAAGKALMAGSLEARECGLETAGLCELEVLDLRPARGEL